MTGLFTAVFDYLARGGLVMVPLVLLSLVLGLLVSQRLLVLRPLFAAGLGRAEAAAWLWRPDAPVGVGLAAWLLREFAVRRSGDAALDQLVLEETRRVLHQRLTAGLGLIGALAASAPLLGLLGTVLGMIGVFDGIALIGSGNPRPLAQGISEALITTQTGLIIAIFGLYMRNFLQRRVQSLQQQLGSLVLFLQRQLRGAGEVR